MKPVPATLLVIVLIAIDQATKWATLMYLPYQQDVDLIPFLALFHTYNTGVAFSFLGDVPPLALAAMTVVIVGFMLFLWSKVEPERWLSRLGFALIVAGALGNLIDRLWLGYVVDMIRVHTDTWSFAVFNIADTWISLGAAAIIIDEIIGFADDARKRQEDDPQ